MSGAFRARHRRSLQGAHRVVRGSSAGPHGPDMLPESGPIHLLHRHFHFRHTVATTCTAMLSTFIRFTQNYESYNITLHVDILTIAVDSPDSIILSSIIQSDFTHKYYN